MLIRSMPPLRRRGRGRSVVNGTSIHDQVTDIRNIAHVASEDGLEAATRTMPLELAADGIGVNSTAPGAIEANRDAIDGC